MAVRKDAVTFDGCRKCWGCKEMLPLESYSKKKGTEGERHYTCKSCCNARAKAWYAKNKERGKASRAAWARELRKKAMESLGGSKCRCCSEIRVSMLDIDHRNGDGAEHRRKRRGPLSLYHDVISDPGRFQVLCCNCNQSKRRNGGSCEHITEKAEANRSVLYNEALACDFGF